MASTPLRPRPAPQPVQGADRGEAVLRRFRPEDEAEVVALVLAGLEERWGRLDRHLNPDLDDFATRYRSGVTLTAWLGERLVGTGTLLPRGRGVAEVRRMSTAADCRRRGVATGLLAGLLSQARRQQIRTVILETTAAWSDARSFYERHGFLLDREVDGEFGRNAHYRLALASREMPRLPGRSGAGGGPSPAATGAQARTPARDKPASLPGNAG